MQTTEFEGVRDELERVLAPDFAAYTAHSGAWVSVFAEELETHEIDDLERLAIPLSKLGRLVAFLGEGDDLEVWRFPGTDRQRVSHDELGPCARDFGIALEYLTHFDAIDALEEQGALPDGFVRLEREPEKPGLKEFFGRSQDE